MAALYTGHMGTGAEQTLFDKCFVGELKALHTGVEVEVNGTLYFIQARLIQHRLDTKAIGKFLYVHEANSSAGCPLCSDGRGTWDAELRKVVYGDRRGLCMMHARRRMGNSRHCCPGVCKAGEKRSKVRDAMATYVERCNQGDEETDHQTGAAYTAILDNCRTTTLIPRMLDMEACVSCDHSNIRMQPLREALRTREMVWHHGKRGTRFYFDQFQPSLQYEHCDLRSVVDYGRVTHQRFQARGKRADLLGRGKHVDGVKGSYSCGALNYADIERDISFDGMHALGGCCKHILSILSGARSKEAQQKYSMETNTHYPHLHAKAGSIPVQEEASQTSKSSRTGSTKVNPKDKAQSKSQRKKESQRKKAAKNEREKRFKEFSTFIPWILSESEQYKIDAWINSILIPTTYGNQFQVR
jgi:hypothetical protein